MSERGADPRAEAIRTLQTFPRTEQTTALAWALIYYVDTIAGRQQGDADDEPGT